MIKATAPGKIYLFGEHAVVYGYPALACSINKKTTVKAKKKNENTITIIPENLKFKSIKFSFGNKKELEVPREELKNLDYVRKAIEKVFEINDAKNGLELRIQTKLPIGGGLGSSASVTVATLFGLNELLNLELTRKEIAKLAFEVEKEVQGNASPCDTYTSTMGGLARVEKGKNLETKEAPNLPIVIGYTNNQSDTKELVEKVEKLKNKNPEIINNLFASIRKITEKGQKMIEKEDLEEIGELMNVNQGILDSIGVNNLKLSKLIYSARKAGAHGSKITGAGGGGCMIALANDKDKVANAIKVTGGKPIKTEITNTGAKIE